MDEEKKTFSGILQEIAEGPQIREQLQAKVSDLEEQLRITRTQLNHTVQEHNRERERQRVKFDTVSAQLDAQTEANRRLTASLLRAYQVIAIAILSRRRKMRASRSTSRQSVMLPWFPLPLS